MVDVKMLEFAGEEALVDEFQPAVFPLNRADFVVEDLFGLGGGSAHPGKV
jgi:hypothetical protein